MIRKYTNHDEREVIDILRLNTPKYFDHSEEELYRNYLQNKREDYFVLVEKEKIIGSGGINYFLERKNARLSWDLIHPQYQGKGFGKLLTYQRINIIKTFNSL